MLEINQKSGGVGDLLRISQGNEIRTIITNNGNLGLGNFQLTNPTIIPLEKLHVIGNVIILTKDLKILLQIFIIP